MLVKMTDEWFLQYIVDNLANVLIFYYICNYKCKYKYIYQIYMEDYIKNFESFEKKIVYDFRLGYGGIGDNLRYFMYILDTSMKNNKRVYYKKNNIETEKYIKLKYDIMYIDDAMINQLHGVDVVIPQMFYAYVDYLDYSINLNEVFYFTDEVKINSKHLFPQDITSYISIHLRLGDRHLETDGNYVVCKDDERKFSEEKIHKFIEENYNEHIFFCCDNNSYKLKLKEKYNNIIITNCDVGHTSLSNTTEKQILDAITEFYILTNSKIIFAASTSGFSTLASKFNNTPLIK